MQKTAVEIKVGDKLAFNHGIGQRKWVIHSVEKITPSGRIKCGPHELNPDLSIRGSSGRSRGYWGPYRGYVVTPEIAEEAERQQVIERLADCDFSKLSIYRLRQMAVILDGVAAGDDE